MVGCLHSLTISMSPDPIPRPMPSYLLRPSKDSLLYQRPNRLEEVQVGCPPSHPLSQPLLTLSPVPHTLSCQMGQRHHSTTRDKPSLKSHAPTGVETPCLIRDQETRRSPGRLPACRTPLHSQYLGIPTHTIISPLTS